MRVTYKARVSANKLGKPIPFGQMVPGKDRFNYKHRLFWRTKSNHSAEKHNCIIENYRTPCIRRWLEYIGGRVPKGVGYRTIYRPPALIIKPERYWVLKRDDVEESYFTNVIEAWLVCVSANHYTKSNWTLCYVDLN